MTFDDVIKMVQTLGFPVCVSVFLLWRYEKKLDRMNGYLSQIIGILKVKVEEEKDE